MPIYTFRERKNGKHILTSYTFLAHRLGQEPDQRAEAHLNERAQELVEMHWIPTHWAPRYFRATSRDDGGEIIELQIDPMENRGINRYDDPQKGTAPMARYGVTNAIKNIECEYSSADAALVALQRKVADYLKANWRMDQWETESNTVSLYEVDIQGQPTGTTVELGVKRLD